MSSLPQHRTFVSAKTTAPVPVASRVAQLALIQATLDPDVIRIDPPIGNDGLTPSPIVAVLTGHDGPSALLIGDAPARLPSNHRDLRATIVDRAALLAEPIATDLRMIWSCATRWYAPGDQVRILQFLSDNGQASLIEAAQSATASVDGVATVLALACRGLVELDLSEGPLGPETRVRRHHSDAR
ncbi:MAG: hypothetical protein ACRYGP_01300 [Janthinobacterium lividum]